MKQEQITLVKNAPNTLHAVISDDDKEMMYLVSAGHKRLNIWGMAHVDMMPWWTNSDHIVDMFSEGIPIPLSVDKEWVKDIEQAMEDEYDISL